MKESDKVDKIIQVLDNLSRNMGLISDSRLEINQSLKSYLDSKAHKISDLDNRDDPPQ